VTLLRTFRAGGQRTRDGPTTLRFCSTILKWTSPRRRESTGSPTKTSSTRRNTRWRIEDQEDDTRLYLGPSRSADLLEIVTIVRDDGSELAIHAMKMRAMYERLLPGGDDG
jgi:hypothetical protein